MITKVNFVNFKLNPITLKGTQLKNNQPHFGGIMDNPGIKKVTDANGNTYIVEPGGKVIVHQSPSGKGRTVGTAAAAGAGTGLAADKISDMKNSKTDLEESHANQNTDDKNDIDEDITKTDVDDDVEDTEIMEDDDNFTSTIDDGDDADEDDDDDLF